MEKRRMKPKRLLWIDLEMTGLEPEHDRILEVAAIVTDWDFNELADYVAVVQVDPTLMATRMVGKFWEENQTARRELLTQNATGKTVAVVEEELLAFVREHFAEDEGVLLAGNSIHQDRKFIDSEWPRFAKKLHYRMLDVSAWKVVFEGKYHNSYKKLQTHRALDDIRGSIEELAYYIKKVKE